MRALTSFLLMMSLMTGLSPLAIGQTTPDLSDLMSDEEITAMGLDKLSPEQQQSLVQWLLQKGGVPLAAEQGEPARTTQTKDSAAATGTAMAASSSAQTDAASVAAASAPATSADVDNFGKPPPQPDEMRSRIPGTFTGWTGDSQFVLENGQVWQQRYDTRWKTELENPEVVITRHMLGLHRMEIVGTGKSVPVKRIK